MLIDLDGLLLCIRVYVILYTIALRLLSYYDNAGGRIIDIFRVMRFILTRS